MDEQILNETFRSILESRPDLNELALTRTRTLMNESIRDVLVEDYEHLIDDLELPDLGDRHVLAAAIASEAQVIVTFNLVHFPPAVLERFDIEAQHPDQFVKNLITTTPDGMSDVLESMGSALQRPNPSLGELMAWLRNAGLPESSKELKKLLKT
jgi:hypothetical protein